MSNAINSPKQEKRLLAIVRSIQPKTKNKGTTKRDIISNSIVELLKSMSVDELKQLTQTIGIKPQKTKEKLVNSLVLAISSKVMSVNVTYKFQRSARKFGHDHFIIALTSTGSVLQYQVD